MSDDTIEDPRVQELPVYDMLTKSTDFQVGSDAKYEARSRVDLFIRGLGKDVAESIEDSARKTIYMGDLPEPKAPGREPRLSAAAVRDNLKFRHGFEVSDDAVRRARLLADEFATELGSRAAEHADARSMRTIKEEDIMDASSFLMKGRFGDW